MKHIKRKFLSVHKIADNGYDSIMEELQKSKKPIKEVDFQKVPHLITTEKLLIQSFFYDLKNTKVTIPEPNPIVIYFSNAQGFLVDMTKIREDFFKVLQKPNPNIGDMLNHMFAYFGCVSNFASSLFNSIESFINSKIPMEYKYYANKKDLRRKPLNKFQILRNMGFESKVELILSDIFEKSFHKDEEENYKTLLLLKDLRNNMTHAKADIDYSVNYYDKLFKQTLDFDFLTALESARDFINYYEPNLIEPCDCGKTH